MLRKIAILLILIYSLGKSTFSQVYQYKLIPGFLAQKVLLNDNFLIWGLGNDSMGHYWLFSELDQVFYLKNQIEYRFQDTIETSSALGNKIQNHDNFAVLNCSLTIEGGNYNAFIALLAMSSGMIKPIDNFNLGKFTFLKQSFYNDTNSYVCLGNDQNPTGEEISYSDIKLFFYKKQDTHTIVKLFPCGRWTKYFGCGLRFRNALQTTNKEYLIAADRQGVLPPEINEGLILKLDSSGNEIWRLPIRNDTTTIYNLLIMPLANGNTLAIWNDPYFLPGKGTNQSSRWVGLNEDYGFKCAEISQEGTILREWNLRNEIYHHLVNPPGGGFPHSFIKSKKDGGLIIVGQIIDKSDEAFLMKLDENGNFKWFRKYWIQFSKPKQEGWKEKLFLYGVTELDNGNFALAGEYRSPGSDSFPNGTQQAIVLFVDSFGCLEPGCHKTDGIATLKPIQKSFIVYPNPSTGAYTIKAKNNQRINKIEIYDALGRTVNFRFENQQLFIQETGLYLLKIYSDKGTYEVHQLVKN